MELLAGQSSAEYTRSRIQPLAYQGKGAMVILVKGAKTCLGEKGSRLLRKQTGDVL